MYHQIVSKIPKDAKLKHVTSFLVSDIAAKIFVEIKPNLYTDCAFGDYYHVVDGDLIRYSDAWKCLDIAEIEMGWDEICSKIIDL